MMESDSRSCILSWIQNISDESASTPPWDPSYSTNSLMGQQNFHQDRQIYSQPSDSFTSISKPVAHSEFKAGGKQIDGHLCSPKPRSEQRKSDRSKETDKPQHLTYVSDKKSTIRSRRGKRVYERKPRHKTREARYEYKGGNNKGRVPRTIMKIRKHTVNDNFHASNVARSRLTLKPHTHRGIFNRGKTSPPVKMRQDLCFSEMEFLSNKPPTIQEPVNTGYQLRGDGGLNSPQMNNNPLALPATVVMKDQQQACHASPNQDQDRPPVHTNKSAQYKNQGDGSSDRTAILYSWSETVRLSLPPQDPFEAYTERLLNANLDTYDTNDKDMISNQPKKYWNLEELAYLLEQRTALWDSNTDVPTGSTNQNTNNTNIKSLKRKRASLIEQEVPVQTTSAARINGNCYYYYSNNNIEQHISSETPNNQVSEVEAAAPSKGGINIKNRSTQALLEDNTMERTQTQEQDDIMDVLMEDFTLYSGESSFNPFSLPSEDMGRIPYFGQSDEPSMSKRLEASMWPYRQNQNRDMTDAAEPLLSDRTLIKQALSAAYDVIMNPEKDPLYNGHTYDEKMDSAMKSGPTSVCSDEDAYQVSETFQDPSTGGHFGKPLLGQALPSYPYRATGEKQLLDPMDWNYTAFRSPPVEHFPETICSASEMQGLKIEAESRPCFKTKLEFQASLHSELGKFWRPQKLY